MGAAAACRARIVPLAALVTLVTAVAQAAGRQVAAGSDPGPEERAFRVVLRRQVARYPLMDAQDVYKLVHQATMGSRHAGLDSAMAAAWLDREIAGLDAGPDEPVVDTISGDGRMVRVNLRPFLAAGGDRAALVAAFVRTAREHVGSEGDLRRRLGYAERMADAGLIPVGRPSLRSFFESMRSRGYPATEHSDAYRAAYRPAYRVVLRSLVP